MYSPFSFCLKVSTWILKGTPFSPPCFRGVNSVLMQCTWKTTQAERDSETRLRSPFYLTPSGTSRHSHRFKIFSNQALHISQMPVVNFSVRLSSHESHWAFLDFPQSGASCPLTQDLFPSRVLSYLHSGLNGALRPRVLGLAHGSVHGNGHLIVESFRLSALSRHHLA